MKFKASIKPEPRGIVTGQFNGTVDARGLYFVSRKQRTIEVPLRASAHRICCRVGSNCAYYSGVIGMMAVR